MKFQRRSVPGIVFAVLITTVVIQFALHGTDHQVPSDPSKLLVVWTSADKEVAVKMVYMYTYNAKKQGWFDRVRFLVWGPSSKLLSEDKDLQDYIGRMKEAGVELLACKACADLYGVSEDLTSLGITVKYTGKDLTEMLQSDWKVLTF